MAIGGQELPNGDPDETFVWAVTVLGRVYVRQRVTTNSPEGTGWLHIPTPVCFLFLFKIMNIFVMIFQIFMIIKNTLFLRCFQCSKKIVNSVISFFENI